MANLFYLIDAGVDERGEYIGEIPVGADKLTPPTHEPLFNFLRHDLSPLDEAMNALMSSFDIGSLEVKNAENKEKLQKVCAALCDAHPYYSFGDNAESEIADAIAVELNLLLHKNGYGRDNPVSKAQYLGILNDLNLNRYKQYSDEKQEELYDAYKIFLAEENYYTSMPGHTFEKILETKDEVQKMLFWVFDFSVPELAHLTISQRAHIYNTVSGGGDDVLKVSKKYSFLSPDEREQYEILKLLSENDEAYDILTLHRNDDAISPDSNKPFPALMKQIIAEAQQLSSSPVNEYYAISELRQLLMHEMFSMLNQSIIVKKCRYCGNYFIAENLKNEYCNGIAPNENKPCSEIGSQRVYQSKVKKDEAYTLYQRAYKTHFARIKKGKMTQMEFSAWGIEGKQKMTDAREGRISMDEYAAWLKI